MHIYPNLKCEQLQTKNIYLNANIHTNILCIEVLQPICIKNNKTTGKTNQSFLCSKL